MLKFKLKFTESKKKTMLKFRLKFTESKKKNCPVTTFRHTFFDLSILVFLICNFLQRPLRVAKRV